MPSPAHGAAPFLITAAFSYAVFTRAAVLPLDWAISLLIAGLASLVFWLAARSSDLAPALESYLKWPLLLLLAYVAFQLVPLPLPFLGILSPARAEIAAALAPVRPGGHSAALTVVPPSTFLHLLRLLGYTVVFLLVRQLTWVSGTGGGPARPSRCFLIALPLIAVATAQAALGMAQYLADPASGQATGTYVNRNHFAGLLEMVLPLAVMYAVAVYRRGNSRHGSPAAPALRACLLLACAALMLAAIVFSLSRMGFLAALTGLLVAGCLSVRRAVAILVPLSIALALLLLPPERLIERFTFLSAPGEISADTRAQIWRDTLPLIRAWPVVGCGLGAYESVFTRFQRVAPLSTIDYAHNDYLQLLAELGAAGFLIGLAFVCRIVVNAVQSASPSRDPETRYLAIGCLGAVAAISLHSLVDFNLYIPANAMALSWICGMVAGVSTVRPDPARGFRRPLPLVLSCLAVAFALFGIFAPSLFLPAADLAKRGYDRLVAGRLDGPDGAIAAFSLALERDPASPYRWCDLAEGLLAAGQPKARFSIERAAELGPYIPPVLMRVSNFYYRAGSPVAAVRHAGRVLSLVPDYDDVVFAGYARMGVNLEDVLTVGLPDGRSARSYLRFRLARGVPVDEALRIWTRMAAARFTDHRITEDFTAFLLQRKEHAAALRVWTAHTGQSARCVLNGSFETEPAGTVFDWQIAPQEGAAIARDHAIAAAGQSSLRIDFQGTQNLDFHHLSQRCILPPGRYRFEAMVKTDAVTTDEGVGFRIVDSGNPASLDAVTARLAGTAAWRRVTCEFRVAPLMKLVTVAVVRSPSLKFDNKIAGTIWFDDVRVIPLNPRGLD